MPTYRTNGAWGSGIGVNLTPAQVDANFYELRSDLDDLIANPPTADSIVSVSQSGLDLTFHTTLGNSLGPLVMPYIGPVWRGEWTPATLYYAADQFKVTGEGIFIVLADHTSAATFDPAATGGSPATALYNEIIGVFDPTTSVLDDLSDVDAPSPALGQVLTWSGSPAAWRAEDTAATVSVLDDLSDVSALSPSIGQVLRYVGGSPDSTWQPDTLVLDDLEDVSVSAPNDGDVLTYQAGSPTGWISLAPAAVPTTLDALTDVIAPSPTDGDLLQFDGADWVNAPGSSISTLGAATLPIDASSLFEVSEASGSPVSYVSKQVTFSDLTQSIGQVGLLWSEYNSSVGSPAELPASTTTAGWAVSSNYDTAGEVDFWSTVNADGFGNQGFYFHQKTGASTAINLAAMFTDAASYSEIDIYAPDGSGVALGQNSGGSGYFGSFQNVPFEIFSNSITRVVIPTSGGLTINGTTSGGITVTVPAVAGSNTLTLPAGTTNFSATGGTSQVVKQTTAGGAFTVAQLTFADIGSGTSTAAATALTLTDAIYQSEKVSTAQLDKTSNTTLATVTGLSVALTAGKTYKIEGWLSTTSGAAGGLKVALVASGGLTATSCAFKALAFNGTTVVANTTVTALGSNIVANNAVITDVFIRGSIVVNVAGTINVQAAQNTSDGTTTSVFANSNFSAKRTN